MLRGRKKKAKLIFGVPHPQVVHYPNNISKIPLAGTPQEKKGKTNIEND